LQKPRVVEFAMIWFMSSGYACDLNMTDDRSPLFKPSGYIPLSDLNVVHVELQFEIGFAHLGNDLSGLAAGA